MHGTLADDYIRQAARNVNDFLYGRFADKGSDTRIAQHQRAYLGFADISGYLDALTYFPVHLNDQREVFIVCQCLLLSRPI